MKTQTFGIHGGHGIREDLTLNGLKLCKSAPNFKLNYKQALDYAQNHKQHNWTTAYLENAHKNYKINRENGEEQDNPLRELTYDGKAEWIAQPSGFYHVKYSEGQ